MSALFGGASAAPPAPTPVPTIDQAAQSQDYTDQIRKRRGFLSTMLVHDPLGSMNAPAAPTASKLILGQ
jgi:hypothetical protein